MLLGKKTEYNPHYNPQALFAIPRKNKRDEIGVPDKLPFFGFDSWNHYEVSWLNPKGKPQVALAEIIYGCDSPNIIESKSMKLYFNSLNNTQLSDIQATIKKDLEERVGSKVTVSILPVYEGRFFTGFNGDCIDGLDIDCSKYTVEPSFLTIESESVEETIYSNLLKSNCPVTNQPDWGSVQIAYKGKKINREGLLRYIVSFRNHNEFHEQCIERIFMDILRQCGPEVLTVYGRYTRRGGLDINPYRSTKPIKLSEIEKLRLCRQ